jgi:uncharacterized protein involved in tolerance to divalent cations
MPQKEPINDASTPLICHITCPSDLIATEVSEFIIGQELCACVKIIPGAKFVYRRQDNNKIDCSN